MQPTGVPLVGGSNPGRANLAPPPARKGTRPGFEPPTANLTAAALPLDRRLYYEHWASPLLGGWVGGCQTPPPPWGGVGHLSVCGYAKILGGWVPELTPPPPPRVAKQNTAPHAGAEQ